MYLLHLKGFFHLHLKLTKSPKAAAAGSQVTTSRPSSSKVALGWMPKCTTEAIRPKATLKPCGCPEHHEMQVGNRGKSREKRGKDW